MSNLVLSNQTIDKRTELSLMMRKIIVLISRDQFDALELLINYWLSTKQCDNLEEKAIYLLVYENIYKKRILPNLLKIKKPSSLTMNVTDAFALDYALGDVYLLDRPYEMTFADYVSAEINRQTV